MIPKNMTTDALQAAAVEKATSDLQLWATPGPAGKTVFELLTAAAESLGRLTSGTPQLVEGWAEFVAKAVREGTVGAYPELLGLPLLAKAVPPIREFLVPLLLTHGVPPSAVMAFLGIDKNVLYRHRGAFLAQAEPAA